MSLLSYTLPFLCFFFSDIIICNNNQGNPLPVDKAFNNTNFAFVTKPPNDNIWVALIIAGRNTIVQKLNTPTGHLIAKVKELNALGYRAAIVSHSIY